MRILDYKFYYFLGIGGIGMSALARYFRHYGKAVAGFDKVSGELTEQMVSEGIECHFEEDVRRLQNQLAGHDPAQTLVIYTPAVPADHAEYIFLRDQGYRMIKRSMALGEITRSFKTIAVAGTHGKTTTTTMIAHLLRLVGINCFAFMGGLSRNYNSNLLLGDATEDAYVVVEADEYDRSFLTLEPWLAVITSVDADHLDIYGDASHVKEGYALFAARVKKNGLLIVKKNVDNELTLSNKRLIYSLNLDTQYCAGPVIIENGRYRYDVKSPVGAVPGVELGIAGMHNVENSVAAVAVAQYLGIKADAIKEALRSFSGVKRRFDYRVRQPDMVYIDDYAHHPEELMATITSVRELYPGKKITGIFQPHLFSRTRDFADGFAASLDLLDECLLLEIYPAREKPMPGVSSQMLLDRMKSDNKRLLSEKELLTELGKHKREVIVSMGAGNIDRLVEPIENIVKNF